MMHATIEIRTMKILSVLYGWKTFLWDSEMPATEMSVGTLPIGSVEFIQDFCAKSGIRLPSAIGFDEWLLPWLHRDIRPTSVADIASQADPVFIKPRQEIKRFSGFVLNGDTPFEKEQRNILKTLPQDFPVWVSEVVSWQSEWRYYVVQGMIIGAGRYDPDGADDAPKPAFDEVKACVDRFESSGDAPAGYAMDFGVLDTGKTALVEINDGWALGYYPGSLNQLNYAKLLFARWCQIAQSNTQKQEIL